MQEQQDSRNPNNIDLWREDARNSIDNEFLLSFVDVDCKC